MSVYKSKKPTKDGRQYFFRVKYRDIHGIVHDYSSQKFKKREDAVNEEARFRIKIENKETLVSNVTLERAFNEYYSEKIKSLKKQTHKKDLYFFKHLSVLKDIKINNINLINYKNFIHELDKKNLSVDYKNRVLGLFVQILKYSKKYHGTSVAILDYVTKYKNPNEIKKEMEFYTLEEYKKFDNVITRFDYHVFFKILYYIGLRPGELRAITWKDINFVENTISINKTLTSDIKGIPWVITPPKTKNSIRKLPLTTSVIEDLKILKNEAMQFKDFSETWFVFGNTKPFASTTIREKKNKFCELAEVKRIRIHDFRHSCASLLINQGASIALVSKYLGHANISITLNTYTHMYKSELENIATVLNNL